MYDKINAWAFYLGRCIIENVENKEEGEGLVRRLLFDIRGEETAGRFLSKLSNRLADYKINMRLNIDTNLPPILYERTWMADSFYYMKSAVIAGLLNALTYKQGEQNKKNRGEMK